MSEIMSPEIDQLATALAKAQGEMPIAHKNATNPFFKSKYADFESIRDACIPSMSKYGLSFFQSVTEGHDILNQTHSYLVTTVMHSSGQWIKSKARIKPSKDDVQAFSSYATYLKRICLSSIVGIATGEADDDGNAASKQNQNLISRKQYDDLLLLIDGDDKELNLILKKYGINDLEDLSKDEASVELKRLASL